MQNVLFVFMAFLSKYWKHILVVFLAVFAWRKVRSLLFSNTITTVFNDQGTVLSKEYALHYANRLYVAMRDFGTDEDDIKLVRLELSRPSDLRAVWNAFGSKPYGSFGAPAFMLGFFATNLDLRGWLKSELSQSDYDVWEQMFKTAGI